MAYLSSLNSSVKRVSSPQGTLASNWISSPASERWAYLLRPRERRLTWQRGRAVRKMEGQELALGARWTRNETHCVQSTTTYLQPTTTVFFDFAPKIQGASYRPRVSVKKSGKKLGSLFGQTSADAILQCLSSQRLTNPILFYLEYSTHCAWLA